MATTKKPPAEPLSDRNARYGEGLLAAAMRGKNGAEDALRRVLTAAVYATVSGRQKRRDITPYLERAFRAARDSLGRTRARRSRTT